MRTKTRRTKTPTIGTAYPPCSAVLTPQVVEGSVADTGVEHLQRFAEELGRVVARALIARRRGYGLAELLIGQALTAVFWMLLARYLMR
jgi:hypothetical protein